MKKVKKIIRFFRKLCPIVVDYADTVSAQLLTTRTCAEIVVDYMDTLSAQLLTTQTQSRLSGHFRPFVLLKRYSMFENLLTTQSRTTRTHNFFFRQVVKTLSIPRIKEGSLSVPGFYFLFNIWQDAAIRTRVAATAARCATNELHTSLMIHIYPTSDL